MSSVLLKRVVRQLLFLTSSIAVLTCVPFAIWSLATSIFTDQSERIQRARVSLAQFRSVVGHESEIQAALDGLKLNDAANPRLAGTNDGEISANLQVDLKMIVTDGKAHLNSTRTLPPVVEAGIRYIGSQLEVTGSIAAIRHVLMSFEDRTPFLFVKSAIMRASVFSPKSTRSWPRSDQL